MSDIIQTKNLFKIYDETSSYPTFVLKDINFSMEKGDFICIMGPSGAGKTTLLNCISLTDKISKGNVEIDGKNISSLSSKQLTEFRYKNLGLVFQEDNLLHYLTVYENIAFPLTLFNEKKSNIENRVAKISDDIGVSELLNKYPFECSGGQRQRVEICRAIINNPKILIADEPTGNLDSKNSHELMRIFKSLNNKGMSILMVTHDPMVASYSNKVVYIKDGEIKSGISKGSMLQSKYFYEIVQLNSEESLNIMK